MNQDQRVDWRSQFNTVFGVLPKSQPMSWEEYAKRMRAMGATPTKEFWLALHDMNDWPKPETK